MRYIFFTLLFFNYALSAFSQKHLKGFVADSISRKPLPFATIRPAGQQNAFITGISGQFSFSIAANIEHINVSYIGYASKVIAIGSLKDNDTLFLIPVVAMLGEVIVKPQTEKIRRIINAAVRNKPSHNPELYDAYQCNMYYKMKVDLLPSGGSLADSAKRKPRYKTQGERNMNDITAVVPDSVPGILRGNNHIVFSETYSKRLYKRPQQLQEIVIASRLSGLKKTYFTNLITEILPFHVYSNYITLNGKDYINPVSKGWQQLYDFFLADEISNGYDTTYLLTFRPKKNVAFNALKGMVYINSDGYAISHFISSTGDTASDREIRIEQVYDRVDGRWFPKELNYDLIFRQYIIQGLKLEINGHSVIDSVSFALDPGYRFEKAYPLRLSDSVDLHSEQDWKKMRTDSLSAKEMNTYRIMDSLFDKKKMEKRISSIGKLVIGRLPYKSIDIDILRLLAFNNYEDTRVGIGVYTNDKLSKYYSTGGWIGYGLKDKRTKYGFSVTGFARGNKDNWLRFFYSDDYQNAGSIRIHTEIDRGGYRKWLLSAPDRVREYGLTAHAQRGYLEIETDIRKQKLESLYVNNFEFAGKNYKTFNVQEGSIGLRYAYGEKRSPVFGYYFPVFTKYPIVYFRSGLGTIKSGDAYSVRYIRALMAVNYHKHINRWGNDAFRVEAGLVNSFNNKPFSRSFLLAAKGFRRDVLNFYAWGGFLTMRPYDYYTDRYASFLYKHDFDKWLWQLKFSRPFISLAHNLVYGNLSRENKIANPGIVAPVSGYHESGILLNQLLQKDFFHITYINLNAGAFYHWTSSFDWRNNGVWVIGISASF